MSTRALSPRLTALTLAAVALFGLTACTPSPTGQGTTAPSASSDAPADAGGDDGQSVAEACTLVQDAITDATAEFDDAEDPAAVVTAMTAAAEELARVTPEITNDEIAPLVPTMEDQFGQIADLMQGIVDGDTDSLTDLEELGTGFQTTIGEFQELCAS